MLGVEVRGTRVACGQAIEGGHGGCYLLAVWSAYRHRWCRYRLVVARARWGHRRDITNPDDFDRVIQAGSGAPSRFLPPIWRHRTADGCPVGSPWAGSVAVRGRRACRRPRMVRRARSGRWASTVPGDGPVWAPGSGRHAVLPSGVGSPRAGGRAGHRDRSRSGHRWYPVPDGDACAAPGPCVARSWRGVVSCHPVPSGGVAGSYPCGPTTGHSGVPSWWEKRGRGFQPDNSHSRGGTARAGSPHSGHARAMGVPVARGGVPVGASLAVMASGLPSGVGGIGSGPGTSVPGPERGGFSCRCSPVPTEPGWRCRHGWRRPGPGRGCRSWGRL